MKTRFSRRPKLLSPRTGLLFGAGMLVVLAACGLRIIFPDAVAALARPVWSLGDALTSGFSVFSDAAAREDALKEARATIETLTNENALLRAEETESEEATHTRVPVLARPPVSPYDVLVLDAGTAGGVYEGMRVFAHGAPIGVIASASAASARVALFSAPGKTTDAWAGEERVPLTLVGAGAGAYRADAPRDSLLAEGDTVYLFGTHPIGIIVRIERSPSSPRAALSIRPAVNLFSLTSVDVAPMPAP